MTLSPRMELTGPHFCATMYTAYRVHLNTLDEEGKFLATFQDFFLSFKSDKIGSIWIKQDQLTGPLFCATMNTTNRVDLNTLDEKGKFSAKRISKRGVLKIY